MEQPARRRAGPKGPGRSRGAVGAPAPRRVGAARIVLASVGPPIPHEVVERLTSVASDLRGGIPDAPNPVIHVLSIARIWGTSLGFPNPGLYPNRVEIDEQREIVDSASAAVERRGFEVKSRILTARDPAKVIARYAERIGARAIVLGDPMHAMRPWERAIKGNPAKDLGRRTRIPLHIVPIDAPMPRGMPSRRGRGPTRRASNQ